MAETELEPGENIDHLAGWTAQDESMPAAPAVLGPQLYLPEQIPEDQLVSVPEHQMTDDPSLVDPPGGILVNRETASAPDDPSQTPIDESAAAVAAPAPDLESMTKAELQAYADEHAIAGVNQNSQNRDDMLAAIEAAEAG